MNLNQVTLPATDVARSSDFYASLEFRKIVSSHPQYARFECPEGGATFSLHQVDQCSSDSGFVVYFECQNVDSTVADLINRGFSIRQMPRDERWLWREARLSDPDGNEICLYQAGENRRFPPWRLEDSK